MTRFESLPFLLPYRVSRALVLKTIDVSHRPSRPLGRTAHSSIVGATVSGIAPNPQNPNVSETSSGRFGDCCPATKLTTRSAGSIALIQTGSKSLFL